MNALPRSSENRLPLEAGDVLTLDEFERRYEEHAEIKRAELINGVVYVSSPVGIRHSEPHADLIAWLGAYRASRQGVRVGDNGTVRLPPDSEVQPDASLRYEVGRSRRVENDYIEGPPELAAEVAASSASYDLHAKMEVYRQAGVQEYIVWRVYDAAIDWFELRDGKYERLEPGEDGVVESRVFPGLRLAVGKMLAGDLAGVLAEQQRLAP